jgi:TIR domain
MGFDVFISYSNLDRKFVEQQLKYPLEMENLIVAIDYRDFSFGEWTEQSIYIAIKQSSWVLLALTPAWVRSEWCNFEARYSLSIKHGRVIPVILECCEAPNYLNLLTWCDLTDTRYYYTNFTRLVTRLKAIS